MVQNNLALSMSANKHLGNILVLLWLKTCNALPTLHTFYSVVIWLAMFFVMPTFVSAQSSEEKAKFYLSIETDPAFWAGTLANGVGFDANINFRLAKLPKLRLGILAYTGKWSGDFGKSLLLTKDFKENDWKTQWNGLGIEAQYQIRMGLARGGLQWGLRAQWNQFLYYQNDIQKGKANHFVLTPQVGFQWFPFKKWGLYVLPWTGAQLPIAGTGKILINKEIRETRKLMPILTAHVGWECRF